MNNIKKKKGMGPDDPPTPIDPNSHFGRKVARSLKNYKAGKTIPLVDAIQMLIDEEES